MGGRGRGICEILTSGYDIAVGSQNSRMHQYYQKSHGQLVTAQRGKYTLLGDVATVGPYPSGWGPQIHVHVGITSCTGVVLVAN